MIYRTLVTLLFAVVVVMGCTQASFRQSDVRPFKRSMRCFTKLPDWPWTSGVLSMTRGKNDDQLGPCT